MSPTNSNLAVVPAKRSITPASGNPKVAHYEELEGGAGREIFFRPDRYRSADLGPVQPVVCLLVAGAEHICGLVDISQNGIAFRCPEALQLSGEDRLEQVTVTLDGHEVFRGAGRVVSVRDSADGRIVGLCFDDGLVSIDDVLVLRDLRAWAKDRSKGLGLSVQPWYVTGHERFKSLVGDLRLFFDVSQAKLAQLETTLPFQVVHSEMDTPARAALIELLQEEFVRPVVRYTEEIDASVRGASADELEALKDYSLRQLGSYFMQAPSMARARHKPLGYAGDFEVMRHMYERHFDGTTLFSRALNLAFTHTRAGHGVRARKDVLKQELRRLIFSMPAGRVEPLRILAIAAGPAQEMYELLSEVDSLPLPLEVYLLDQERQALSYGYSRLKRVIENRWAGQVNVKFRYDTIRKLLTDRTCLDGFGEFDMVYAAGLFDYLGRSSAVRLTENLFQHVGPKGSLFIGNMSPANPTRWLMEHHADWYLIYRSHAEMVEFATAAAPDADVGIVEERTGVNPFVRVTRR
jgi:extracellular factor (EF) 3-hydroxypalmitic acid methyl ester biosynthesis protein